jgi:hypothetical protein
VKLGSESSRAIPAIQQLKDPGWAEAWFWEIGWSTARHTRTTCTVALCVQVRILAVWYAQMVSCWRCNFKNLSMIEVGFTVGGLECLCLWASAAKTKTPTVDHKRRQRSWDRSPSHHRPPKPTVHENTRLLSRRSAAGFLVLPTLVHHLLQQCQQSHWQNCLHFPKRVHAIADVT